MIQSNNSTMAIAIFAALMVSATALAQTKAPEEPASISPEISNPSGVSSAPTTSVAPNASDAVAPAPDASMAPTAPGAVMPPGTIVVRPAPVSAKTTPESNPVGDARPGTVRVQPAPVPAKTALESEPPECKLDWVRDGFYLRVLGGLGLGFTSSWGDGPTGEASISGFGPVETIIVGGSIMRGLTVAGMIQSTEITHRFKGGPFADATITSNNIEKGAASKKATVEFAELGALVDWYPSLKYGLHAGIGVGLGLISLENQADASKLGGISGAATLLVGYDWPIAPAWALGVALVASGSTTSSLKHAKSGDDAGYKLTPLSAGISVSILYF